MPAFKRRIPQLFLSVAHGLQDTDNSHFLCVRNKQDVTQLYLYWQPSPQISSLHHDIPEKEYKVVKTRITVVIGKWNWKCSSLEL